MHKYKQKCQRILAQLHTQFPRTILYLKQIPECIFKIIYAWLLLLCLLLLAIFTLYYLIGLDTLVCLAADRTSSCVHSHLHVSS